MRLNITRKYGMTYKRMLSLTQRLIFIQRNERDKGYFNTLSCHSNEQKKTEYFSR